MTSRKVAPALAVGALLLTALACSQDAPTAPQLAQSRFPLAVLASDSTATASDTTLIDAQLAKCDAEGSQSASAKIGKAGGELKVGSHRLVVPAGAVAKPILITATIQSGAIREIEFEPHGLVFNKPVHIRMNFARCTIDSDQRVYVAYLDPGNQIAAIQPSSEDKSLKIVDAWTDHFSGYAVAVGRR